MNEQPNSKTLSDYIVILVGRIVSLFSSTAINFVIIWLITIETASAFYLSLASFISFLPLVIITPFAGVFSDILNRKIILLLLNTLHILTTLIFIFLFAGIPELNTLFVFLLINSIYQAFYQPTFFAIIPSMVSQKHLGRINGLGYILTGLTLLIAPVLASILINTFPINQILWVSIIANGIMLFIVLLIKIPQVKEIRHKTKDLKVYSFIIQFFKQFLEGFRVIIMTPSILILFGALFILDFFGYPFNTLLPYFIFVFHEGTAFEYATISFLLSLGMIVGSIVCIIKKYWNPVILILFLSIFLTFLGNLVIIFVPYRSFDLIYITFFIKGFLLVYVNILFSTLIQSNIPNNKLGRVNAIYFSIASIIPPFASFRLTITLALTSDFRLVLFLSAIVGIIYMIIFYMFTGIRQIRFQHYKLIDNYEYNHN